MGVYHVLDAYKLQDDKKTSVFCHPVTLFHQNTLYIHPGTIIEELQTETECNVLKTNPSEVHEDMKHKCYQKRAPKVKST